MLSPQEPRTKYEENSKRPAQLQEAAVQWLVDGCLPRGDYVFDWWVTIFEYIKGYLAQQVVHW